MRNSDGGPGDSGPDIELRHLRYFVALADAGSFTDAARRMHIAQPTLSQQIRRLEELIGAPLLIRRREGLSLTEAGAVLLEEGRAVLAQVHHGVDRTRRAAGLGPARLRVLIPPDLPAVLAVELVSRLRPAASAAAVEISWTAGGVDPDFSPVRRRQADAALGWLRAQPPDPLDAMALGDFEPDVWLPAEHPAADRGTVSLEELARMTVLYGPRADCAGPYETWRRALRSRNPGFEFVDPEFPQSLPMTLALAAAPGTSASGSSAALTAPRRRVGTPPDRRTAAADGAMVPVRCPLACTAGLVWHSGLPRDTQQILFDIADGITGPDIRLTAPDQPR
jgi:DNA-binding transcriptional LysR family regulator